MRIYCDGIFDLFHIGHLNHFRKIHKLFEEESVHLIVGVISDKVASEYKRLPIINEKHRLKMIQSLLFVGEAFITDMLVIDDAMIICGAILFHCVEYRGNEHPANTIV
jgi:cytidyltransferase-like protein